MYLASKSPAEKVYYGVARITLLAIVLSFLIACFFSTNSHNLSAKALQDSSHSWVFFIGTLLLFNLHELYTHLKNKHVVTTNFELTIPVVALAIGIAIELLQPYFDRDASFLDLGYDLLGILTACVIHHLQRIESHKKRFALKVTVALLALLISLLKPMKFFWIEKQIKDLRPVLYNFDTPWQQKFIAANNGAEIYLKKAPQEWLNNNSMTVMLAYDTRKKLGKYPGISYSHFWQDWSMYQRLSIDIFLASNHPSIATLRINDKEHNTHYEDRFNYKINLNPGLNSLKIDLRDIQNSPANRLMNLEAMQRIILFETDPTRSKRLYIDNIRLE